LVAAIPVSGDCAIQTNYCKMHSPYTKVYALRSAGNEQVQPFMRNVHKQQNMLELMNNWKGNCGEFKKRPFSSRVIIDSGFQPVVTFLKAENIGL